MNDISKPPTDTEAEISVFGPGYGECIIIHLCHGDWAIIDSCVDSETKKPVSLNYLRSLEVDPSINVKLVVATHWHSDHIRGLSQVFQECSSADFVCSAALNHDEFRSLVSLYNKSAKIESSGIEDFNRILNDLENREKVAKLANANKRLWYRHKEESSKQLYGEIISLAPSDASIIIGQSRIAKLIPNEFDSKKRIMSLEPNDTSVVLFIKIGALSILLGADLEEVNDPRRGWTAILESDERPNEKSSMFKIPHHGSENGHHPNVWTDMLIENPFAVTTPFNGGKKPLPTNQDAKRICSYTPNAFLTTPVPSHKKPSWRPSAVRRTIAETVRWIKSVDTIQGHIRMRREASDNDNKNWNCELFNKAIPMSEVA